MRDDDGPSELHREIVARFDRLDRAWRALHAELAAFGAFFLHLAETHAPRPAEGRAAVQEVLGALMTAGRDAQDMGQRLTERLGRWIADENRPVDR
jgi:hypothetical protein